ncbi:MAG: hypothetical protein HON65_06595 [Rhodospirillales bacterium]|nr:hypothetical protein [Rhodospirillales bacterium]
MAKNTIIAVLFLMLSACAGKDREMPTNESGGSDDMRISPCVCNQIEHYNGSGFEWAG